MQYIKRYTILFVLFVGCMLGLWAAPARKVAITVEQPDNTRLELSLCGDEHFHCLITTDGIPVIRQESAYYYALIGEEGIASSGILAHDASRRSPEEQAFVEKLTSPQEARASRMQRVAPKRSSEEEATSEVPTKGDVYIPVLLVQYADTKFSSDDPKNAFENRINGDNYTDEGGYGSIREYFIDQSKGIFSPQFDIIGPITLSNDMKYYGGNDKQGYDLRPREMVSEACRKVYTDKMADFTRYDNNNDGYVDIVYIIYAGYGEASYPDKLENTIWPHQWGFDDPLHLGGVKINRYACNNELDGYTGANLDGIGTFCHEFSHCLGLPDLYDTSSAGTAFGMSMWSLMDYGCYNNNGHTPCGYTAYEKDYLGWETITELNTPTNVTLTSLSEGGEAYKIVNDANPNEYYIVEYCAQKGWNAYAPASGMLVMHVDYQKKAWEENTVNNNPKHPRMTIIPADGKLSTQTLTGDTYPGTSKTTELTATSSPAAKVYTGGYMNKDITRITAKDNAVTFDFMQGALQPPHLHTPTILSLTEFSISWDAVEKADAYDIRLDLIDKDSCEFTVHTAQVEECQYTFKGLVQGSYRCRVRIISNGIYSHYSEALQVELIDSMMPSAGDAPHISIHNDSIYIQAPDSTAVYYTLDGSYPTAYSIPYTTPFTTTEKATIRTIALRDAHRNTPIAQLDNWFADNKATYRLTSTAPLRAVVAEAIGGNDADDYRGYYTFGDTIHHDTQAYILDGFDTGAFRHATALRSITVEASSMRYVGDSLFHGCPALNAVVWDAPIALPDEAFDENTQGNLLVYLPDTMKAPASLTRRACATLIRNHRCGTLALDSASSFYCPRSFIAQRAIYRRTFTQSTGLGTSSGWETITLPFNVTHTTHSTKGHLSPFGTDGDNHYWLATPRDGAFAPSTEILANTPYIISMPSHEAYGDYSMEGTVTFSAENAVIHATPINEEDTYGLAAENESSRATTIAFAFISTYDSIEAAGSIYALNVGNKYEYHAPGSVFVPGRYDTPPFSACMIAIDLSQAAPYYRIALASEEHCDDDADAPKELSITSRGGFLYIVSPYAHTTHLYDHTGRMLRTIICQAGTTEVGPLSEGIYIIERTKVYVDR